jgi:hypothetical protein
MSVIGTEVPVVISLGEPLTVFNAAIIVNNVYQQDLEPTQAGYIPKRIANKIRQQLKGKEMLDQDGIDLRLEKLVDELVELGVLQLTRQVLLNDKPVYIAGPEMKVWSQLDMVRHACQLLGRWVVDPYWPMGVSLVYENEENLESYYAKYQSAYYSLNILPGRHFLVQYFFNVLQQDTWYDIGALLEDIFRQQPGVLRVDYSFWTKKKRAEFEKDKTGWMKIEGTLFTGMIVSTLFEMGLVVLGYKQENITSNGAKRPHPYAVRINEFGAQVLKDLATTKKGMAGKLLKEITEVASARKFIIQPNFELLLLEPDWPALYSVLPFVQVKQVGHSSTLQLTQNTILRGMKTGLTIDQIIETLKARCQNELPQNVIYSLRDWAKQYRVATISQVMLIEVPETLTESLMQNAKLKTLGVRLLAPGILAIDEGMDLKSLKSLLDKQKIVAQARGKCFTKQYSDNDDDDDYDDDHIYWFGR